jgi:hypothetical protein
MTNHLIGNFIIYLFFVIVDFKTPYFMSLGYQLSVYFIRFES